MIRTVSQRLMTFALLLLATVLTNVLPLPLQAASLGFALAALVVGIRTLRFAWRAGVRGRLVRALAVGLTFTALLSVAIASPLAVWPVQLARQQCLQRALTIAATQNCQLDFQRTLNERLQQLRGAAS